MDQWMDGPMDGWTNGWTNISFYTDAIDASENKIVTDQQTNRWTDSPMDRRTDIPSYRGAIVAFKKLSFKSAVDMSIS